MATAGSNARADIDSKSLRDSEKVPPQDSDPSLIAANGDEALKVVGLTREVEFTEEEYLRVRRKIDRVIPPLAAAVYFTQYIDKAALNYASIMGLPITGQHYNLVSMGFYLGFLIWEFPTMYIAQHVRIAKYLSANIILWGVVMMLHAAAPTFGPFFALRILLGALESCVGPILIIIISMFYKKEEQGRRISWFYFMIGLTSVFGGFVAYGISFASGTTLAPYKILYYLLGALAIVVGLAVLRWMPDSPVHARFLTPEERVVALERVRDDQGGTENKTFKRAQAVETLTDVRTWLIVLTNTVTSIPFGALGNFSNIIIRNFGYTSRQALILSTPSGLINLFSTLLCGYFSDKTGERMLPLAIAIVPAIIGGSLLVGLNGSGHKGALLFGVYIIGAFGAYGTVVYAWVASNTAGHTKKVMLNSMVIVSFAVGNIIGTETFLPKDAPDYIPGKISIVVLLVVQIAICFALRFLNIRLNRQKAAQIEAERARRGWSDADLEKERQKHAFADLTDRQNMFFVYTK